MSDPSKTYQELAEENSLLKQKVQKLEIIALHETKYALVG